MFPQCLFALGSAALLLFGECVHVETRESAVEIVAMDLEGTRLSGVEVEYYALDSGVALRKVKSAKTQLLYGDYRVRVYARGFRSAWRQVRVYQPALLVRMELEVAGTGCPPEPTAIGGRVQRNGNTGEMWVKAVPLRGTEGGESPVADTGHFLISGLARSAYLLVVMQGDSALHEQVVKTIPAGATSPTNLNIQLNNHMRR